MQQWYRAKAKDSQERSDLGKVGRRQIEYISIQEDQVSSPNSLYA